MDDDDYEIVEEVIMLDLDEEGRKHNGWSVATIILEFLSDIAKVVSNLFNNLGEASYQHGTRAIRQQELEELVTREIEMLPETED